MQDKKIAKKKESSLESLKQKYLNATHDGEKKILLAMIKLKDPKFKG